MAHLTHIQKDNLIADIRDSIPRDELTAKYNILPRTVDYYRYLLNHAPLHQPSREALTGLVQGVAHNGERLCCRRRCERRAMEGRRTCEPCAELPEQKPLPGSNITPPSRARLMGGRA